MHDTRIISDMLLNQNGISGDDVCYVLRLSGLVKRRANQPQTNKFSGFMTGLTNTINDTFNSAVYKSYLLRMNDGTFVCVTENAQPVQFDASQIYKQLYLEPDSMKFSISFMYGDNESAAFTISRDNFYKSFSGNLRQMFADFEKGDFQNLSRCFVTLKNSLHADPANPYKVRTRDIRIWLAL